MLSRILAPRDGVRVAAEAYIPASLTPQLPKVTVEEGELLSERAKGLERETAALRDRIRQLEQDVAIAKRDSFESGRRQGEQQARLEVTPVLDRLHAALMDFTSLRSEMRRRAEKDVVQLALLIAKRILHREVAVDPNALSALARVLFERMAHSESYRVTVHPNFAPGILATLPANLIPRILLEPDPTCQPGTLLIRSDEGLVDASVESQLEEIGRGLTDRLTRGTT